MTNTTPAEPGRRALRIRVLRETLHRLTTTETGDSPTEDLAAATVRRVLTEMLADMTPSPDTDTPTTPAPHACGNCEGTDPDTCLNNPDRPRAATTPAPACGPACAEAHTYQPGCAQCIPGGWVDLLGSDDVHEDPDTTPAPADPALAERVADALPDEMPTTPAPVGPTPTWATLVEAIAALPPAPPGPHPDSSLRARVAAALLARIKLAVVKPEPLWPGQIGSLLAATEYDLADVVLAELAPELARARQIEELLDIAHETSNRSEAERAHAVERAEQAETALAAGIPLVCSDERHQAKVTALEAQVRRLNDLIDRLGPTEQQQRHRAEQAETALTRVRDLADRWDRDAPPPGNRPLTELRTALTGLTGPAEENQP